MAARGDCLQCTCVIFTLVSINMSAANDNQSIQELNPYEEVRHTVNTKICPVSLSQCLISAGPHQASCSVGEDRRRRGRGRLPPRGAAPVRGRCTAHRLPAALQAGRARIAAGGDYGEQRAVAAVRRSLAARYGGAVAARAAGPRCQAQYT